MGRELVHFEITEAIPDDPDDIPLPFEDPLSQSPGVLDAIQEYLYNDDQVNFEISTSTTINLK